MPKLHLFLSLFYKCIIIIAAAWGVGMCTFNPGTFGFCDTLPYMGVMYYVLIMLVALLLFGRLYIAIATWIRHRS